MSGTHGQSLRRNSNMNLLILTSVFAVFCQGRQSYFFDNVHTVFPPLYDNITAQTVEQLNSTSNFDDRKPTGDSDGNIDFDMENSGNLILDDQDAGNLTQSGNLTEIAGENITSTNASHVDKQGNIEDAIYVNEPESFDFSDAGVSVTSGVFHIKKSGSNLNLTGIHNHSSNVLPTQEKQNKSVENNTDISDKDLENMFSGLTEEIDKLSQNIIDSMKDEAKKTSYGEKIRKEVKFLSSYHATGTLSLPYDGIVEPFEAWFAGKHNLSRIDYYYGMDKTFQRGDLLDYGVMVKVMPAHYGKNDDLDKNTISCWYRPGFRWNPVRAQSVLPTNLKDFKFVGEEIRSGMPLLKYFRTTKIFNKNHNYTFYITKEKPHRPVRYVMHGLDTLLHSFYDHYVLDYLTFHPWKFDFDVMKIPKGNYCEKKLRKQKSKLYFNPMAEFMHENFNDDDVEQLYQHYKEKHNKTSADDHEHETRKHIFRHNMRFIRSHNRAGLNYTLDSNELADLTDEEFDEYKGMLIDPSGGDEELKKQMIPQVRFSIPHRPPPRNLDWREYGAVTPPTAQGHCGSCWTFSAMGAIEGAYAVQTGKLQDFSEQQLLDCSWGYGNYGCRGGFSWRALVWAKKFGVTTSKSYGRYLAQEGYCHCSKKDNCSRAKFARVMTVPKLDEEALRLGLAWYGPASIAINVNRKSFKFYKSGVLDDPKCTIGTNHGVVAVGYGVENGKPFWLVKNSWGKLWGDEGFIKVSRNNNTCGVLTNEPIFVKFNATKSYHSKQFPFLRMNKTTIIKDKEKKLKSPSYKYPLSPFDYKRSHIDLWTPPDHIKEEN